MTATNICSKFGGFRCSPPKDELPIKRFLNFLEMKSHTGEEMANQVLQYLREVCKQNF